MKTNQDAFYENERLEARIAELEDALREVVSVLCGRIGGCLGNDCGCVKGALDHQPSSELRRRTGWKMLRELLGEAK